MDHDQTTNLEIENNHSNGIQASRANSPADTALDPTKSPFPAHIFSSDNDSDDNY